MPPTERPRVLDIALRAGVSTATVDRVLHNRGGVTAKTTEAVRQAIEDLASGTQVSSIVGDEAPRDAILPQDAGLSTSYLAAALRYYASSLGVKLRLHLIERMNPRALADALTEAAEAGSRGVAFQALDHPLVRECVHRLQDRGIPVTTLVSGLASSINIRHVGIDNRAAGRTAAYLIGRFLMGTGKVAVLWSGSLSRAHEEREAGFRALLRNDFPDMEVVDLNIGRHEAEETAQMLHGVLRTASFAGFYCVGAGLASLVRAVSESPRHRSTTTIGHNLTTATRDFLISNSVDAVLHQDMIGIAEEVVKGLADPERRPSVTLPVVVVTRENCEGVLQLDRLAGLGD